MSDNRYYRQLNSGSELEKNQTNTPYTRRYPKTVTAVTVFRSRDYERLGQGTTVSKAEIASPFLMRPLTSMVFAPRAVRLAAVC
jgi:hypothetical protein